MHLRMVGAFVRNAPFGTEIAFLRGLEKISGLEITAIDSSCDPVEKWNAPADVTMVFKTIEEPEHMAQFARCTGKKVVFQPDDLRFPHIQQMMRGMREHCEYALTFDEDGARMAVEDFEYDLAQKLIVTADPKLYAALDVERRDIDFAFIGSMGGGPNHRSRARMVEIMEREFPGRVLVGSGIDIPHLIATVYNRTKVVLNHATDVGQPFGSGYGYQCRHFEVGLTRTCLLSNSVLNDDSVSGFETFDSEESLLSKAHELVDTGCWRESGKKFYDILRTGHLPVHRAHQLMTFFREIGVRGA